VKGFHNVNEATMHFFRDFESDIEQKQNKLVRDLAAEVASDKLTEKQEAREKFKRKSGYVRM